MICMGTVRKREVNGGREKVGARAGRDKAIPRGALGRALSLVSARRRGNVPAVPLTATRIHQSDATEAHRRLRASPPPSRLHGRLRGGGASDGGGLQRLCV